MPAALQVAEGRRSRRKGEETYQRILDAAEDLFAEHGFAGTTLRDVAARVGIRNPSLYNHFTSKESLYAAVLERGIAPVLTLLTEVTHPEHDAGRLVERIMELLSQRPSLPRLILHETLRGGERLTPMLRDWIAPTFKRAQEMVQANPAAERWGPDRVRLLVLAMYHIVLGYFTIAPLYKALNGDDLLTKHALAEQTRFLVELVESLFAGPTGGKA